MYEHLLGSLKCHSSSISNTAWGNINNRRRRISSRKESLCSQPDQSDSGKGSMAEQILSLSGFQLFPQIFLRPFLASTEVKLIKKTSFIMRFMTHDCLMELNLCFFEVVFGFVSCIKKPFIMNNISHTVFTIVAPRKRDPFAKPEKRAV